MNDLDDDRAFLADLHAFDLEPKAEPKPVDIDPNVQLMVQTLNGLRSSNEKLTLELATRLETLEKAVHAKLPDWAELEKKISISAAAGGLAAAESQVIRLNTFLSSAGQIMGRVAELEDIREHDIQRSRTVRTWVVIPFFLFMTACLMFEIYKGGFAPHWVSLLISYVLGLGTIVVSSNAKKVLLAQWSAHKFKLAAKPGRG